MSDINQNMHNYVNDDSNYTEYQEYNQGFDSGYESGYRAAMQMQQNMMADKIESKKGVIVVKCIIIYLVAQFIVLSVIAIAGFAIERFGDDTAYVLERADYAYNEMNYRSLNNTLYLYGNFDEKYDKYWEFLDGYNVYVECQQWAECHRNGLEGSKENLEEKYEELKKYAAETAFDSNREIFNDFIEEIDKEIDKLK